MSRLSIKMVLYWASGPGMALSCLGATFAFANGWSFYGKIGMATGFLFWGCFALSMFLSTKTIKAN